MRSVLGSVLKAVLIDPNVNAIQTQQTIERFSDPTLNALAQTFTEAEGLQVLKDRAIERLTDYLADHPDMDEKEWKDWREKYDKV